MIGLGRNASVFGSDVKYTVKYTKGSISQYQYEDIWLLRTGATVIVSDRDDLWPPHRLAMLTGPYRREALSFDT